MRNRGILTAIYLTLSAMSVSCERGCPSVEEEAASGQTEATQRARDLAKALSGVIVSHAESEASQERAQAQAVLAEKRSAAEAEYQAARSRRERHEKIPRAKLHVEPGLLPGVPEIRYESLIAELYGTEAEKRPGVFVRDEILSPQGKMLLDTLERADEHALNADDYSAPALRAAADRLSKMKDLRAEDSRHTLNTFEIRALSAALERGLIADGRTIPPSEFESLSAEAQIDTTLKAICTPETTPVPRAAAMCRRELDNRREQLALADALDFALADAYFAYARAMKYGNLDKFSEEERKRYTSEDNPHSIHPKYFDRIIEERLRQTAAAILDCPDGACAGKVLAELVPQHEQYARLQAIREIYRGIAAEGGWKVIPPDRMFAGGRAPLVKMLKERLAKESYYEGDIDDNFDAPLTAAIKSYQHHHQLSETGEVGDVFWRSLNVGADQRLAEIEENIRRWHKSMYEPRDRFIYINVPSFEVELWNEGARISKHRIVVGNSTRICNTRTREWELMNATPLMHARMTYLVFNPYWNVPPRIEVDEFAKKIAEDPHWIEKSDYEYYNPRSGGRVLRQKPGPNNALGKVKMIFPNPHNTYLHDTPKKEMFTYDVRAFSHGCMRVEGAMEFAQEILTMLGQWDEKQIDRFFKEAGEHALDLNTPIDVFIDYHTVTADDDGKPRFLADVYKYIRDEIHPPTALDRRCDPSVDRTSAYRSGGDEGP